MSHLTPENQCIESDERLKRALVLEREACQMRQAGEIQKAFAAYDEAGNIYRELNDHLKSSFCYSAAATCWNIHTGWQPLSQAASRNLLAAREAMKVGQYDYARSLFREAALLYEKEGDSENYSICFISSQHAGRKRAWELWTAGRESNGSINDAGKGVTFNIKTRVKNFIRWFFNILNEAIWGYGEKPFRTLAVLAVIILGCAVAYSISGNVIADGAERHLSILEGIYFSIITFTTVGFGDFLPGHWTRCLAAAEALSGMILVPLFLIGLTRRYLRMYR
jgi:tetratricopeptide (TPR) repeat protein